MSNEKTTHRNVSPVGAAGRAKCGSVEDPITLTDDIALVTCPACRGDKKTSPSPCNCMEMPHSYQCPASGSDWRAMLELLRVIERDCMCEEYHPSCHDRLRALLDKHGRG